jgi:hypothetical protein
VTAVIVFLMRFSKEPFKQLRQASFIEKIKSEYS